jgi:pyrimidine deaminase RibD-like protein
MSEDLSHAPLKTDLFYLSLALTEARKSPPKPTNFCVGACLVAFPQGSGSDHIEDGGIKKLKEYILATGYTLECPGNTHAEQSCFIKLSSQYGCSESELGQHLADNAETVLYTTMEPCNKRSAGNAPCVDRILGLKRQDGSQAIQKVVVGVTEPGTFVEVNEGRKRLEDAGIQFVHVSGHEKDILAVATAGHEKSEEE